MRSKIQKLLGLLFVSAAINAPAQAALVDQYTVSGYVSYSWSPQAAINLFIDGSGVNQTVHLYAFSGTWGVDYKYWGGVIPNDAVLVKGIAGIEVHVDTCEVLNIDGCGLIDVTIDSAPGWDNFQTYTGVYQYQYYNGTQVTSVGHWHNRYTTTTGTINGHPIDIQAPNWGSTMSKTLDMSVRVDNGN